MRAAGEETPQGFVDTWLWSPVHEPSENFLNEVEAGEDRPRQPLKFISQVLM